MMEHLERVLNLAFEVDQLLLEHGRVVLADLLLLFNRVELEDNLIGVEMECLGGGVVV